MGNYVSSLLTLHINILYRTVTAGKIYVEVERARLTHKLALLKEADGDTEEAATAMQEMPVETFGSMEKKEKVQCHICGFCT